MQHEDDFSAFGDSYALKDYVARSLYVSFDSDKLALVFSACQHFKACNWCRVSGSGKDLRVTLDARVSVPEQRKVAF